MSKLPDWPTRLDAYFRTACSVPFSYDSGVGLDCCTFTFGAIRAMTGNTLGLCFQGTYRSVREARIVMRNYCGRPSVAISIAKLMQEAGYPWTPVRFAQRGDVGLMPNGGSVLFGVVDLNGRDLIGVGANGLCRLPLNALCTLWRVG